MYINQMNKSFHLKVNKWFILDVFYWLKSINKMGLWLFNILVQIIIDYRLLIKYEQKSSNTGSVRLVYFSRLYK